MIPNGFGFTCHWLAFFVGWLACGAVAYPFQLRFRYMLCLSGPRACAELRGRQGMARGRSLAEFQKAFANEFELRQVSVQASLA